MPKSLESPLSQVRRKLTDSAPRNIPDLTAPLADILGKSVNIMAQTLGGFTSRGTRYEMPKFVFVGPKGGGEPIRIGLFAAIHGDEPEGAYALIQFLTLLDRNPDLAKGYCLFVYPLCNPTGFEDRTRQARCGKDLNREFWSESREPEVRLLENEIQAQRFHGIVTLHADDTSGGMYGFVRGATLTRHLLIPALAAAETVLPRNQQAVIDGFSARNGIIRDCYHGILSAPPRARPKPFEIILETPQAAPQFQQQQALILALNTILDEYRKLIAYAANL